MKFEKKIDSQDQKDGKNVDSLEFGNYKDKNEDEENYEIFKLWHLKR